MSQFLRNLRPVGIGRISASNRLVLSSDKAYIKRISISWIGDFCITYNGHLSTMLSISANSLFQIWTKLEILVKIMIGYTILMPCNFRLFELANL